MIRYALVMLSAAVMGCAAHPPGGSAAEPVVAYPKCQASPIRMVRQVQASPIFRKTAWMIASSKIADSTGAAAYVDWLCGQLHPFVLPGWGTLALVAMQSVDDPHIVDVAFAVADDRVVLLSPLKAGYPVGGLDTAVWNGFAREHFPSRVTTEARARTLACALYVIKHAYIPSVDCQQTPIAGISRSGDVWLARFLPLGDTAVVMRIAEDGTVR